MTEVPPPPDVESSKSWKQARLMAEQADPDLPDDVPRRVPADVAARFRDNDLRAGRFYDRDGDLLPDPSEEQGAP